MTIIVILLIGISIGLLIGHAIASFVLNDFYDEEL